MVENGETEKLSPEPKMRDASTGMSQERLSLMIKYNQIGSLTSLSRGSKVSILIELMNAQEKLKKNFFSLSAASHSF